MICINCHAKDVSISEEYSAAMEDLSKIITGFVKSAKEPSKPILMRISWYRYLLVRVRKVLSPTVFHHPKCGYDGALVAQRLERELNLALELALKSGACVESDVFANWDETNDYVSCNELIKRVNAFTQSA